MKRIFLLALFILVTGNLSFADNLKDLTLQKNFKLISPDDEKEQIQVKCSGWSEETWFVGLVNGDLDFIKNKKEEPVFPIENLNFEIPDDPGILNLNQSKQALAVEDGYLISFTAGEWGGSLWWFSKDGKQKSVILPNQSSNYFWTSYVNDFIKTKNNDIYLLVGVSHLALDLGGIIKIKRNSDGLWQRDDFYDLASSAFDYFEDKDGSYLILTGKGIIKFVPGNGWKYIYGNNLNHQGLGYASTIVKDSNGIIYVGSRYKIVRLTPILGGYQEEWLIPDYCEWKVKENGVCECTKKK